MLVAFNSNSPQHLSLLLFGGFLPVEEVQDQGFYKNGKPKTKKVKVLKNIQGLGLKPLKEWKTKKEGIYSTDDTTLNLISKQKNHKAAEIASLMLEIRALEKLIGTYYESTETHLYPDGYVHPQFNHVSTSTGRLSCKAPNVQNQPQHTQIVNEHFISRFTEGQLISADYTGLEVRVEAQLSQDVQYISDIINGIDFHIKNLSLKENLQYEETIELVKNHPEWAKKRSQIKGFTFAQQYGAGNKKIAEQTGFTEHEVQKIRDERKIAFPRLHLYYDWLKSEVNKNGYYSDPWGRIYKFKKYPPRFNWQKQESYSPTEIQNWRSQGFATATVVLSMIGKFWREKAIYSKNLDCKDCDILGISGIFNCTNCYGTGNYNKYLMINTIHDSVMLDCRKEFIDQAKQDLTILTEVAKISKEKFDYNWIVPIEIEIKTGERWSDL